MKNFGLVKEVVEKVNIINAILKTGNNADKQEEELDTLLEKVGCYSPKLQTRAVALWKKDKEGKAFKELDAEREQAKEKFTEVIGKPLAEAIKAEIGEGKKLTRIRTQKKDFKGELKISGDLYTNANIVIAARTDVTFQGQSAATQSTETPAKKAEWIKSGSRWWYKHADGSYTTNGWEKINGTWYYFDQAGWMATGWVKDNGTWYYLDASGAMQTGWKYVGSHWYYLNGSGALLVNTTTPDGYTVNGNGELV